MATTARRTSVNGASGGFQNMDLSLLVVVSLSVWQIALAENVGWTFQGPYTYVDRGDPLEISSAGAVQDVAFSTGSAANTRSASSDAWFIGGVNSGVWRTRNFHDSVPTWENVLDKQKPAITCASIGALHVSSTNPNRIYAGCGGSTSSEQGHDWNVVNSGDWGGVMFSLDQGDTWKMVEQFPLNYYITAIYESKPGSILVAAQSNVFDKNDGGIWLIEETKDHGFSVEKVHDSPTFTIQLTQASPAQVLLATHPRNPAHSVSFSRDFGRTWSDGGTVGWKQGTYPFYTCSTTMGTGDIVVAGLTTQYANVSATGSQFFIKRGDAWIEFDQPTSMDEDGMPKDRMAILADPTVRDLMYVAGNAGALAWRVNTTQALAVGSNDTATAALRASAWVKMWDKGDVLDGSLPHGDCRNYAWDPTHADGGRLILVSDGGIFGRVSPRHPGGQWVSLNGDYASMELLSAHYDNRERRFVVGAQDNCAQVFSAPTPTSPRPRGIGFVEGDGTVTIVDNVHAPARLFGTTQFLGVGTIDIDPSTNARVVRDDDDDCGGLCFAQGDTFINVPIDVYFPEPSSFPYFVQPYALNTQDPTKLVFWANGTTTRKSGLYVFDIHDNVTSKRDIGPPELLLDTPPGAFFLDIVSGGFTSNKADPALLIGISTTMLYVKNSATDGALVARPLPTTYAVPVTLPYDASNNGVRILGPLTHGRTVSMSVSPKDSNVIAITGWTSIRENKESVEEVWVTSDGGVTWTNVTCNLKAATRVTGIIRPGGVLVIDFPRNQATGLLVSTSNGVMLAFLDHALPAFDGACVQNWTRFGDLDEFPVVPTSALSYEHYSDTLVAATFGRGVYTVEHAKDAMLDVLYRQRVVVGATLPRRVREASSAAYFPKQQ